VENLRDELQQANKDGDYEKRQELLEELDEARAKLDTLKIDKAEDSSDQDRHTHGGRHVTICHAHANLLEYWFSRRVSDFGRPPIDIL
jgi:hypothetical protein